MVRTVQQIAKHCGHLIRTKVSQFLDLYESDYDRATSTDALIPTLFHFRPIETVCLNFCMELLNQRIGVDEYECALVCVLALLGRSCIGWYTPDSFPSILSKIVKLVRFMVFG
ncbi:unnamed protein product [Penicillium salamii]|nr:unnamed protein product [Penicillium salamii]